MEITQGLHETAHRSINKNSTVDDQLCSLPLLNLPV